jgi:hypothetical protein
MAYLTAGNTARCLMVLIHMWESGIDVEIMSRGVIWGIYLRLRRTTTSAETVSGPRFEPRTLWIRSKSTEHSTATSGSLHDTNSPYVAQCTCTGTKQLSGRQWNHGSSLGRGNRCFYSPTRPDWPQLQSSVLFSAYRDRVSSSGSRGVKLNTHFHWVPKFRTSGAIPPLPNIPSFVHRDNFILSLQLCKPTRCWCNESANLT